MSKSKPSINPYGVRSGSEELIYTKRKFFNFVQDFLGWYKNSFGKSEVQNHLDLIEFVKKAEDIYMGLIKENEQIAEQNHKKLIQAIENFDPIPKKKKVKRISRYL